MPHKHKPRQLDDLFQRIDALEPDPDQPSEEEICQMVKEVRHKRAVHESNKYLTPIINVADFLSRHFPTG